MYPSRLQPCCTRGHARRNLAVDPARLRNLRPRCEPSHGTAVVTSSGSGILSKPSKEYPVEVRVYNIDRYGMKNLAPTVLKKKLDAIWHCGIAVYGSEYWFDHRINCEDLEDVEYAFGFGPTHVFDLGKTTVPKEDFEAWLYSVMAERYQLSNYDFEKRNCHHFANELALHLTGNEIPEWCVKHGEDALSELDKSDVERIRWASNKVARVMMVTWGRYNKARFVKKKKLDREQMRANGLPAGTYPVQGS